jgi:hypothetical protein
LGIGTTPSYKLHIIESTTNGRAVQGVATATSGTNYGAVLVAEGIGATKNIGLYASAEGATTNVAAIFDKGNVGIGTSSPTSKFEIYDNVNSAILRLSRDAGNARGQLQFGRNNGGSFQECGTIIVDSDTASVNNGVMYFYTSNSSGTNTERMRITSVGNLEMRPITFSGVANNATQTVLSNMGKGTWLVSVANDIDSSDGYSAMLWVRTNEIIQMQVFRVDSMVFSYTNQDLRIQNTSGFTATLYVTAIRMAAS